MPSTSSPFPPPHPHLAPKLTLSTSSLPPYISPTQPPTKKTPFRQISALPFVRNATLVLPKELYDVIIEKIPREVLEPRYARFIAPLGDLLEGRIFKECVRRPGSNLSMLSEGVAGVDDKYWLKEGKLTMDLGKQVYQRSGLQGVVRKSDGGRRHVGNRWRVDVDLRAPGSVDGKMGFEKVKAGAGKSGVLGEGRTWLCCDVERVGEGGVLEGEGMEALHPVVCEARVADEGRVEGVLVPDVIVSGEGREGMDEEEWWEVVEWVDLVALGSPRVIEGDDVDSYISRYKVPEPSTRKNLRVIEWDGLMSSEWITRLIVEVIKHSRTCRSRDWVALSVIGHEIDAVGGVDGYTIVLQPGPGQKKGSDTGEEGQPQGSDMEVDTTEAPNAREAGTGLQRVMCLQFVDSVVT